MPAHTEPYKFYIVFEILKISYEEGCRLNIFSGSKKQQDS